MVTGDSEFSAFRSSGKCDHVPDITHACDKLNHSFKAQSKTCMRDCSESSCVKIPPKLVNGHMHFFHSLFKFLQSFFSLRASNDFPDSWCEDIHCSDRFSVIILAHVKCFDLFRVIG